MRAVERAAGRTGGGEHAVHRGIDNHIPFVNGLVTLRSRMREQGWQNEATDGQRAALKRELEPFVCKRSMEPPLAFLP